jgi:hypothetical protein
MFEVFLVGGMSQALLLAVYHEVNEVF